MELQVTDGTVIHVGDDSIVKQESSKSGITKQHANAKLNLIYSIDDVPPWYLCLLLGFQHYLTMFGATIALPLIMAPALCITDTLHTSELISTCFFVSGLITILQVTFGIRLPIVQGGTFAFLVPAFAILSLPQWKCPSDDPQVNVTNTTEETATDDSEIWKLRMREIQGAVAVASIFQVVIGMSGIIGLLLRFLGPLVIAPTIALIGLTLFNSAADFCASNWWIALMTMVFTAAFSQYLRNINIPCCAFKQGKGCKCTRYPVFKLFPIILAVVTSWAVCGILTATNAIPDDDTHWAYGARTDTKIDVLHKAKWFRFPYPGQWGLPTVSTAAVFGMLAGVLAGMIESIGDYYACARLSGAPPPPIHAINRGIMMEGIGCILAGIWGTGTGTTSYSENIGAIGITRVGSRRVMMYGGGLMMILGLLGKFGALFVTIPNPIIGGIFMVMFGMITAVGISNLQYVDMNSSRNLFIFGFSLFFGLSLPQWIQREENSNAINTGNDVVDQIFRVLLSTSMFVGGTVAFILDNTVPGTEEERGMTVWRQNLIQSKSMSDDNSKDQSYRCYDLPFGMSLIRKWTCTKYIPFCPTFNGLCQSSPSSYEINEASNSTTEAKYTHNSDKASKTADDNLHHRKNSGQSSKDTKTNM